MPSETDKYRVYVLWLKGHTLSAISAWTKLRTKQVAGLVTRSPWPNRSALSSEQRQEALDDMKAIRFDSQGRPLDGGMFDRIEWPILPLDRAQKR